MDKSAQADFDHDIRNPVAGIALELKRITESLKRIERYVKRMDEACEREDACDGREISPARERADGK
jgi:hypothetical protein